MRRRLFLLLANALPGLFVLGRARGNSEVEGEVGSGTLAALVDTIVPADESPGALDIGIGEAMSHALDSNSTLSRALATCVEAADRIAMDRYGVGFSRIDQNAREAVFMVMLDNSSAPQLRASARRIRGEVVRRYYLHPAGQASAGYTLPWPQGYRIDTDV